MAEEKKLLLSLETDFAKALKDTASLEKNIEDLKATQKTLDKSTKEGREEYTKLGAQIKNTSTQFNKGKRALADMASTLSKNTSDVDKFASVQRLLKDELADYTQQLILMVDKGQQGSEAYNNLKQKATELQAQLNKTKESTALVNAEIGKTKATVSNTSVAIKGIAVAFKGFVGALGLASTLMNAFGSDNEKAQETMKKMQIIIAALVSSQALFNAIQRVGTILLFFPVQLYTLC